MLVYNSVYYASNSTILTSLLYKQLKRMTIKPFIEHLTEVSAGIINKSEKKIIEKFLSTLNYIGSMNLTSSQDDSMIRFIQSLKLKTYRGGNKRVIKRKLDQLINYLKSEFSLISDGYYTSLGIALGPGFGLSFGVSMATAFGADISIGLTYGLIIGMFIGMFVGIFMDDAAKKKGRVISNIEI